MQLVRKHKNDTKMTKKKQNDKVLSIARSTHC